MFLTVVLLVVGIALVLLGADKLTDGATGLARRFNVTEMVIGLTVVAFGTSLPEFVTSFMSALKGSSEISIGNIVGSNTFNVLMIVGCSALVSPIVISKSTIHKDIPFAILATLSLIVVSLDAVLDGGQFENLISRTDGLMLLGLFAVFMFYTFSIARNKDGAGEQPQALQIAPMSYGRIFLYVILGLAGLVFGGNLFVDAATEIALSMGVSGSGLDFGGRRNVSSGTCHFYCGSQEGKFRHCNRECCGKQYFQYFLCDGLLCDRISDACGEYFIFRFRAYAFKCPDSLVFLLHKTDD